MTEHTKQLIESGRTALGIEFGSTRIKAILVDENNAPVASGSHEWENRYENSIWTYTQDDILTGLQDCYANLVKDVKEKYGVPLQTVGAIGFSAMMHGYMVFDKNDRLLVPFRTWRNNNAAYAADRLTEIFGYHIPARWSIAHLYQAILNHEPHVKEIAYQTTLEGYVHWLLTGRKVIGIGEASGMFPVDAETKQYRADFIQKFNELVKGEKLPYRVEEILPEILVAGEDAGHLTEAGAKLLDPTGNLKAGIPLCPPEGDAGTGMVATNSIKKRTGNVSAGTSVFAMIVLEKELSKAYPEIDLVTTPVGDLVGMVHCNNCTSDINGWVNLFGEFAHLAGVDIPKPKLFDLLYFHSEQGDKDCGGLLSYNYVSNENITGVDAGRPLFVRTSEGKFNLANVMRTHLFSAFGALKVGCDIMLKEEGVKLDCITGHGGLFKTERVGQRYLAAAINAPVTVRSTAGEGGAWGMAILANYLITKKAGESLETYLDEHVFKGQDGTTLAPDKEDVAGFEAFIRRYKDGLPIVREAVRSL
ncbi:MAG: FGGY-family carbohydrate kinase, partial [Clostridiales bacterium]|nr:FGGY-family carbohydrate kinase [Clostridiales bacterium]